MKIEYINQKNEKFKLEGDKIKMRYINSSTSLLLETKIDDLDNKRGLELMKFISNKESPVKMIDFFINENDKGSIEIEAVSNSFNHISSYSLEEKTILFYFVV